MKTLQSYKIWIIIFTFVFTWDAFSNGLNPNDSLQSLEVADGMKAELFASEPMLLSPSSIDIDHKGRVWVAEIVNYRGHNGKRAEGDRIIILEDTDGDGVADESKTYYQGRDIDSPHGVCVLGNKVIVSAGEQVLIFTDNNGDDKPDDKKVLFNVIGGKQHDHGIHAFCFGPDGKLYFNFGNASRGLKTPDGKVIVDKAGNEIKDHRKPYQQGMVFRCDLDGSNVETLGWNFRNNWEASVDSFGSIWQSDNDDDGNRGVRINFVMEFGNYGYRDEFTGKGWRDKRSNIEKEIPDRHWHLNDPGVVPNLIQTGAGSPTGIIVYEGKMFPQLLNQVIHCDAGPNVCRAYPRKNIGAGYNAEMMPILSGGKDKWYRPSDVAVGPDGSLFIADWYDPGVGGHGMRDLERGRIFRVIPKDHKGYSFEKRDVSTLDGAINALMSSDLESRYLGWTSLHKMGIDKTEKALMKLISDKNRIKRARAAWCLGKMPGAGDKVISKISKDLDSDMRIVAIRLARQLGSNVGSLINELSNDVSFQVKRECAIALRELDGDNVASLWAKLALQHNGSDRWYLEALGIAADGNWDNCFKAWIEAGGKWDSKAGKDIVWRSRGKMAPEFLAKIVKGPNTNEEEKPRYMRAFDFHSGPEKDAALQSILLE
ncbi:MAG: PVC-type heme-binding CxxCH protein [Verrucomicrobiales bacterium]